VHGNIQAAPKVTLPPFFEITLSHQVLVCQTQSLTIECFDVDLDYHRPLPQRVWRMGVAFNGRHSPEKQFMLRLTMILMTTRVHFRPAFAKNLAG
jgi:hypothetical protein